MFVPQYTLSLFPPISDSPLDSPLLIPSHISYNVNSLNHTSRHLSTPILRPSKINYRAFRYIGLNIWNSRSYPIISIRSNK